MAPPRPGGGGPGRASLVGGDAAGPSARTVDGADRRGRGPGAGLLAGAAPADLLALTKPRITGLVSLVAGAAYLTAGRGVEGLALAALLLGTALLAGGTNALNQVVERREDGRMDRTSGRPLPAGRLGPTPAVAFALLLVTGGGGLLLAGTNALTAGLGLAASFLYVAAYTPMKKRTPLALPVGAVPGALPALGGWTAATGGVGATGVALFGVLFLWQIPHFLALGWVHRGDYRRAGFAMVAVRDASGERSGEWAVLAALGLLPVSLLPFLLGAAGWAYASVAAVAGLAYVVRSARMSAGLVGLPGPSGPDAAGRGGARGPQAAAAGSGDRRAAELFRASLVYLPTVLVALAADVRLVGSSTLAAHHLPELNAALNATAAVSLLVAVALVRRGRVVGHRRSVLLAAAASAVFLASYLVHHAQVGSVGFGGEGILRAVYLGVLVTHAVLAAAVVPLVVVALSRALRGRWEEHRRVVRWTVPVWLYVSVTGVVVYYMVYVM